MSELVTCEELKRRLKYNKKTGWFTWLVVRSKKVAVGDRAGYEHKGYRHIELNDRYYAEHRLAWFYVTGQWPDRLVDHKNLNRADNRWGNLRLTTDSQNQHNTTVRLTNRTGFLGVYERDGRFRARIEIDGHRIGLGDYARPEQAARAYEEARAAAFGPRLHTKADMEAAIRKRVARLQHALGVKPKPKLTYLERFFQSFVRDKETKCWNWVSRTFDETGYGIFKAKELGHRAMAASRASWIIHNGPIATSKLVVRHKCDNRMCVNPAHLIIGTYKQNMQDCVERDRINRGEDRPQSKLTEEMVSKMRILRQEGKSFRALANEFGVALYCAVSAIKGVTWKHVSTPVPTRQFAPGRHKGHIGEA